MIKHVLVAESSDVSPRNDTASIAELPDGQARLLALAVFYLSAALAGRSKLAERLRTRESMWLSLNLLLALVIVFMAGILKLAPRSEKSAQSLLPAPVVAGPDGLAMPPRFEASEGSRQQLS